MGNARNLADNLPVEGSLSERNLLINGAMQVFQRGTSFSGNSAYNADRWLVDNNGGSGGQSTDAPDGFTYSLKIDPSSGNAALRQAIELPAAGEGGVFRSGQKFTLSFYVKSDNAGEAINVFAASGTNVSATTTAQVSAQTIGTTTTSWVRHIFTFTSNNVAGSDTCYNIVPFVVSPSGATYWTGLMLEKGEKATPYEHEPFATTLTKCERYFQTYSNRNWNGINEHAANYKMFVNGVFRQKMRATPTGTFVGTVNVATPQIGVNQRPNAFQGLSAEGFQLFKWPSSGTYGGQLGTYGDAKYYVVVGAGPTNRIDFDAEL